MALLTTLVLSLFSLNQAVAQSSFSEYFIESEKIVYVLKRGDHISGVLFEKGYQNLYGPSGSVNQTFWKNNINEESSRKLPIGLKLVLPNTVEKLRVNEEVLPVDSSEPTEEEEVATETTEPEEVIKEEKKPGKRTPFYIEASLGARYLSIDQSGALGTVEIGELNPNYHLEIGGGDKRVFYFAEFKSSQSTVASNSGELDISLSDYSIAVGSKGYYGGLRYKAYPIFRNTVGTITLIDIAVLNLRFGYQWVTQLQSLKKTKLKWDLSASIPISLSSDESTIELADFEAYSGLAEVSLERDFSHNKDKRFYYFIRQDLEYASTPLNNSDASVTNSRIFATFEVGLGLEF